LITATVVNLLLLRDVTKKRLVDGLHVNRVLIWYLCSGPKSTFLWIFTCISAAVLLVFTGIYDAF
jgi:hypothetical protein